MSTFPVVLVKRLSAKSGKLYTALYFDLGYRLLAISFERAVIAELLNMTISEYEALCADLTRDELHAVANFELIAE